MLHASRPLAMFVGLSLAALAAGCNLQTPASPTRSPDGPGLQTLPTASSGGSLPLAAGATVEREEFSFPVNIPAPAPCLGGTLLITGEVTGWGKRVEGPGGRVHVTEYLDFSGLTATLGGRTWTASPGAHEIWSFVPPPAAGSGAAVVVHEGHSRFLAQNGDPDVHFVHRIHRQFLPGSGLHRSFVLVEVQCIGRDA